MIVVAGLQAERLEFRGDFVHCGGGVKPGFFGIGVLNPAGWERWRIRFQAFYAFPQWRRIFRAASRSMWVWVPKHFKPLSSSILRMSCRGVSVIPGEFHAIVAHFGNGGEDAGQGLWRPRRARSTAAGQSEFSSLSVPFRSEFGTGYFAAGQDVSCIRPRAKTQRREEKRKKERHRHSVWRFYMFHVTQASFSGQGRDSDASQRETGTERAGLGSVPLHVLQT